MPLPAPGPTALRLTEKGTTVQPLPALAGPAGRGAAALAVQLVLPRSMLDAHLQAAATASSPTGLLTGGALFHGPLTLQPLGTQVQALVARLQSGPPRRLPVVGRTAPAPQRPPPQGLALLYIATPDEAPPPGPAQWDTWLAHNAPEFRLATTALVPDVAVLWLCRDGLACAWLRTGNAWAALQDGDTTGVQASSRHAWLRIDDVLLPGAHMLHCTWRAERGLQPEPLAMLPRANALVAVPEGALFVTAEIAQEPEPAVEPASVRHSRQAAALTPPVLARIQRSRFALVGTSRTGSMLAHSLGRMGASLLVLDPARMAAHSLDGDLPPLHEGQARPVALRQMMRGLLRPGARCDARALPVSSPAAGSLLADADCVLCCTANTTARLWANAWALALLKPLLAVRTAPGLGGLQAEMHLLPPATGCLHCTGGREQPPSPPWPEHSPTPRSWHGVAAHAGLRMLEQMYSGRIDGSVVRQLTETEDGGLQVQDRNVAASARLRCPLCLRLEGAGLGAVRPAIEQGIFPK